MASTVQIIDDDNDDFDWEEAVKEIDAVCDKSSKQSSSFSCNSAITFQNSNSNMGFCPKTENNKPSSSSRQSTLDKFMGLKPAYQEVRYEPQVDDFCNDERVSSVGIDPEAAKTWVYPENVPVRDYQVSITEMALFSNTLVSLPTGLGKTLIAAVVMYNYFRWFPQGKIVFAAPSRPLVMQQIEACHNIVGIPQEKTVDMTGQTSPSKRVRLWKEKRVFFLTPQVLEKDIQSGSCLAKQIVCLVIDEAHRASGNYSYCVAVRELMAVPVQFRILALSATPGSNHQTVQQVIDNLQISSLEHRNDSDPDVAPYVHDRKIELIRVEMGKDAVDVHNLLMDVMRPFIRKLSDIGVLPKRDVQGFSPVDFLNSREKFRDFIPQDLAHKSQEIEGIFGVLLTLHHLRKLLSAHGIRPAFQMLAEKLKQGFFSRFLGNNEVLHKAKLMMQQHLSHGAYSPKFVKMLEVLVEHFNTQDPQKSRVIIFSNFRDSVRDIMSSLATIGEHVKATEFIGQNSGKTSKGQTQKVQQAVLEKFRAGGYNVIVATSIGEEGLDIMEVDLVISFDANISPLRMIQRMGRTGRKSKGRVVVLACEGSEIKGYMRKQTSSKNINKHLVNGEKSFNFHLSPRMVPHVFRPEKKLETLFIEDYVPRGKKVKEDDVIQTPKYKLKLTDVETDLLAKYFDPSSENNWRPSLIAFPHFQAFPSSVHEVGHSFRTTMLTDTMQYLQGLPFDGPDEETSEECFKVETAEHHNGTIKEDDLIEKEPERDPLSPMDISRTEEKHDLPPIHSFLFGSDFMSVDLLGKVMIFFVPSFPLNQVSPPKSSSPQNTLFPNCLEPGSSHLNASHKEHPEIALDVNDAINTEISNLEISNRELDNTHSGDELSIDSKAGDLSPRLTNLLMSGVVPESPIDNGLAGTSSKVKGYFTTPDLDMLPDTSISLVQTMNDAGVKEISPDRRNVAESCMQREIRTPEIGLLNNSSEKGAPASMFVGEIRTPLTNLSNKSCSKDWILSSGEKSVSQPKRKLKRLRKYGDLKSGNLLDKEELIGHSSVSGRSHVRLVHASYKHGRGDRKLLLDARVFIDDEAEASSEASDNEEVDNEQDSYGGSFIDDRINPTMASTQAETAQFDMMAVYRRSLLTQSPIVDFSPYNMVSIDQTHDSGSAAATTPSLHTNNNGDSSSIHLNTTRSSSYTVIPLTTDGSYETNGIKKRRLSVSQGGGCGSLPIRNLETEMFSNPEAASGKEQEQEQEPTACQMDEFDNDDFYQGIDLDALEAQAAEQLRSKSQWPNEKPKYQDLEFLDSPSFDLGI